MDDASLAELDDLRARAYGPAADIAADPAARARLKELEDAARGATAASVPVAVPDEHPAVPGRDRFAPVPPLRGAPEPVPDAVEPATADARAVPSAASKRPRWLVPVLWPVSILVTAIVVAGLTYAGIRLFAGGMTPALREVERVALTTSASGQDVFGDTNGERAGAQYHGMTLVRAPGSLFGMGDATTCLAVYASPASSDEPGLVDGALHFGCTAGALPALVQIGVTGASPEELRTAFAHGTGLQFQLDGDEVVVRENDFLADQPAP